MLLLASGLLWQVRKIVDIATEFTERHQGIFEGLDFDDSHVAGVVRGLLGFAGWHQHQLDTGFARCDRFLLHATDAADRAVDGDGLAAMIVIDID